MEQLLRLFCVASAYLRYAPKLGISEYKDTSLTSDTQRTKSQGQDRLVDRVPCSAFTCAFSIDNDTNCYDITIRTIVDTVRHGETTDVLDYGKLTLTLIKGS